MVTSFGSLRDRPLLCVEIEDADGARGWGEIWCNFPPLAGERRAAFLRDVVDPFLRGTTVQQPSDAAEVLGREFGVQAVQAGEEGLVASVAAGIDQALWDLVARRHGAPLWQVLGGVPTVDVYASGIDPAHASATVKNASERGHNAFKIRAGFSDRADLEAVGKLRSEFGDVIRIMLDANQAWSARHALEIARRLAQFDITWLEEPIKASESARVWRELAAASPMPLAAGENIRTETDFRDLVLGGAIGHVQPDVAKWGGVTRCVALGRWATASGVLFSPHWAGGGIGLAHTLSVAAAVRGRGLAEWDVTSNPLRDGFPLPDIDSGRATLSSESGFGFVPDFDQLEHYRVL
jgi:L-alanine-DL-glutamate epimerase-like enolase superfamily enzyme